jgi:hypothetical protein
MKDKRLINPETMKVTMAAINRKNNCEKNIKGNCRILISKRRLYRLFLYLSYFKSALVHRESSEPLT